MRLEYNKEELLQRSRKKVSLPDELTSELAYLVGALRDGCISGTSTQEGIKEYVAWCSKSREFLEKVIIPLLSKVFIIDKPKIKPDRDKFQVRVHIHSIVQFFKKVFSHPGGKQNDWDIPPVILASTREIKRSFIQGFFDAEGGSGNVEKLRYKYPWQSSFPLRIWSASINHSKCFQLEKLKELLEEFGIHSHVKKVKSSSNKTKLPIFCLTIKNSQDKLLFITSISSRHPEKIKQLHTLKNLIKRSTKAESDNKCVTAYPPRVSALKMEGTKLGTDTLDCASSGRGASCMDRSLCVSRGGPCRNEDPAESSNIAG